MAQDLLDTLPQITLLKLREAAFALSPEGHIKVSTLRLEIFRGRLSATRVGKSYFVTPIDLKEFVERCRVNVSEPACGSNQNASRKRLAKSSATKVGSSSTVDVSTTQAAAKKIALALS